MNNRRLFKGLSEGEVRTKAGTFINSRRRHAETWEIDYIGYVRGWSLVPYYTHECVVLFKEKYL